MVTGAGSGIGKECSLALAQAGFSVVLAGRRPVLLQEVVDSIKRDGGTGLAIPTDVTDEQAVARCFEAARERFGRVALLFNNAGTQIPATPIDSISLEQWKQVVDVNLTGSFLCAREAVRMMKVQSPMGGRIINNGSISAHVPRLNSAPYTATKHAITGLTRSLSLEGRAFSIACGQIDIGNAESDMTEGMKRGMLQADGEIVTETTIDVVHIAAAVVYMASLPLDANVQFMTVMATKMPFIGRG